ncbi:MAG TPA: N-acetylmuramoyl-L-alanine amidase [Solirubrobacteraceae bacterium]|nr:N-acetylmuramoyl-L-alanine amidase [Solirubrobacteraceae bacterium]
MTGRRRTFTRRHVLGGAAVAAGAGLLAGPAGALARTDPTVFSRRLAMVDGVSPVVAAGRRFVAAGVQWADPARVRIELRGRALGGRWSPWGLASVRGHGPDGAGPASAHSGEPLWFGPADEVQLRSSVPVRGVRVQFVDLAAVASRLDGAASARAAAFTLAQPVLPAGPGQPPIIARSAWAGRRHGPSAGPYYGAVRLAFVHHSDGPNGYSAGEVPAMILAIYLFHRFTNGWHDIGYNFVIDAFGRIWEARAGGIDEPVIGAQAGGYNTVSTGVCMLGTFSARLPTPAAISSLERLLAWKLALHGVPARGDVTVEVDPAAAFYTPFRPGQRVLLPRVAGHRQGDSTECPGNALFARLPTIRTRVDELAGAPAQLTLAASHVRVAPGMPVLLGGKLSNLDGSPIPAAALAVQTVAGIGRTTTFATVTTAPDGTWSATLAPATTALVRALHPAAPAAVSDLVEVDVAPVITLTLASTAPLRLAGTIAPSKRSVTLDVYKLSGPHRHLALSRRVAVHRGTFSARLSLGRRARGRYEVVARSAADAATVAAASAPVTVTV